MVVFRFKFYFCGVFEYTEAYEKDPYVESMSLKENSAVQRTAKFKFLVFLWDWYLKYEKCTWVAKTKASISLLGV